MKKLILLSVCLLSLGLAACGDSSDSSSSNNNPNTGDNPRNAEMPTVPKCSDFQLYIDDVKNKVNHTYTSVKADPISGHKLRLLSKEEIEDMLRKSDPTTTWPADIYKNKPDYNAPQYAGALNDAALCAGLNRVNTIRRISGIEPVFIDPDYTRKAQLAALITYLKNGGLSHNAGTNKYGMGNKDFADGSEALSKGNLGNYDLPRSADEWLKDPTHTNVLHRLWMTAPISKKFGFGYMDKNPDVKAKAFNENVRGKINVPAPTGYAVLRACDSGNNKAWDFVAWPAPGYTPLGLFEKTHIQDETNPNKIIYTSYWSVYFKGASNVNTLILEKLSADGKTVVKKWGAYLNYFEGLATKPINKILDSSDTFPPSDNSVPFDKNFAVYTSEQSNTAGAGGLVAPTISFIPKNIDHTYENGDKYRVSLYNMNTIIKQYEVEFFTPKP